MQNIIRIQFIQDSPSEIRLILTEETGSNFQPNLGHGEPQKEPARLPMTAEQAAKFVNLALPTLYNLVSRHQIPFHKPAGTRRLHFFQQDLEEWIKSGRKKTLAETNAEAANYLIAKKKKV